MKAEDSSIELQKDAQLITTLVSGPDDEEFYIVYVLDLRFLPFVGRIFQYSLVSFSYSFSFLLPI